MEVPEDPAAGGWGWRDGAFRLLYRAGYRLVRAWWWLRRPHAHGAALALRAGERLLVLRQSYRGGLGLPAGGSDCGESRRETAARELVEEVGIRLSPADLRELGEFVTRFEGRLVHTTLFEAVLEEPPAVRIDRREIVWADWLKIGELEGQELQPDLAWYLARTGTSNSLPATLDPVCPRDAADGGR